MKKLNKILLVLVTLCVTSVISQANDKYFASYTKNDYKIDIKTSDKLTLGLNSIDVRIRRKSQQIHNADVILSILHPNNKVVEYKRNITNKDRNYSFKVDLPEKGVYSYVLTFNRMGGVIRKFRGNLKI